MRVILARKLGRRQVGEQISVSAVEARALGALGYLRRDMNVETATPSPKKRTYKRRDMKAAD